MRVLGGAEHVLRFALAIDFVNFRKLQNRQPLAVFGRQRDILSGLQRFRVASSTPSVIGIDHGTPDASRISSRERM